MSQVTTFGTVSQAHHLVPCHRAHHLVPCHGTPFSTMSQCTPFGTVSQGTPFGTMSQSTPFDTVLQGIPFGTVLQGTPFGTVSQGTPFGNVSQGTLFGTVSQGTPFVMLFCMVFITMTFSVAHNVSCGRRNVNVRCCSDRMNSYRPLSNCLCTSLISCCSQLPSYLPLYGAREVDGLVNTLKFIGMFVGTQSEYFSGIRAICGVLFTRTLLVQQGERSLASVAGSPVPSVLNLNDQRTFRKPLVISRRVAYVEL